MKRALFVLAVVALTSACDTGGGGGRRRDAGPPLFTDAYGLETPDAPFVTADIGPLPDAPPLPGDSDGDGIPTPTRPRTAPIRATRTPMATSWVMASRSSRAPIRRTARAASRTRTSTWCFPT